MNRTESYYRVPVSIFHKQLKKAITNRAESLCCIVVSIQRILSMKTATNRMKL